MQKDNKYKYYENVIALLPGHVYWKDKDGVFLGCNLEQAKAAGFNSIAEMIGKTDEDMPWSIQADYLRDADQQVMRSKKTLSIEELCELPDGTKKIYLSSKSPLFDVDGQVVGILGVSFDITDRKNLEDALKKAKEQVEAADLAKTEFLENMRHDLRTPLTGIVGFSEIIKQKAQDPLIIEYANNLIAASGTLLDFLNEILEGIKVLTGDMPAVKRKFSLKKIIEKIIYLVTPKAVEKNLEISLDYDSTIPNYVVGDPKRIQRILLELISNALNFTAEGSVKVQINLARKNNHDLVIKCSVIDTGIGIPEDKQEEVFLRFRRLTPSYKGIYKGAGLGLAVVKQFVDDLRGEIYCRSQENSGTTFICLFPLQEALLDDDSDVDLSASFYELENRIPPIVVPHRVQKPAENYKTHVLLVEDQPLAAKVAETIISSLGCSVDVTENGISTLAAFDKNHYDLIFMDIGLPDTTGFELTKQIRAKEWRLDKHVPIVALTAHIDSENKQKCIEVGMDAALSKPLTHGTAKDIISAFVPTHSLVGKKAATKDKASIKSTKKVSKPHELPPLTGKAVDLQLGADKIGVDLKVAKQMVEMLIKGFNDDLPTLVAAKKDNDWGKVKSIIHKHRGGSAYCGTPRFQEAAAQLDEYLILEKKKLREQLYRRVIDEMASICKAMNQLK